MKLVRVAAAALNQTPLDWDANAAHITEAIERARARGVGLLCLPELCLCGYGCEDALFSPAMRRTARKMLQQVLPATEGIAVTLGLPVLHQGSLFNACALVADGRLVGLAPKQHLAGDGLHYEPRWFKPWPAGSATRIDVDGDDVPFGDLVFDLGGVRVGFEICEDAWAATRPGLALAERGVDVILNPSASHFAFGKQAVRRRLVVEGSRAFGVTYVYSNLLGNEAGRAIYDGGALVATGGELVTQGPRFSYRDAVLTDAVVDLDRTRTQRAQRASHTPATDADHGVIDVAFNLPSAQPDAPDCTQPTWENAAEPELEEFTRAIALGLCDYMRKSCSQGFVVSLSGGADSTAVACLVRLMVDLALADWPIGDLVKRMNLAGPAPSDADELASRLLTTAYQATRNSSATTCDAARGVAQAIGARHLELDVDGLTEQYVVLIEQAIGRKLTWERDDIALQNIQARVRAPGVWMLANIENKLLLATSNRSEAAVGYATMDGDTCGGISPIAGIDKAFLRRWLVWLERDGPEGVGPIGAVARVNQLKPTAELRPQDRGQTDEDDLMPYEVLDAVEHQAIGEKRSPAEALAVLQARFPQWGDALAAWVDRFYTLWCRNQWKRERYAPSFHVDDKNLDPKTWCRFPILSGGFRRELREMHSE